MRILLLLTTFFLVHSFAGATPSATSGDSLPKLIIINTFDASSLQVRKNKRELFADLTDSLQVYLLRQIEEQLGWRASILSTLAKADDSSILSLMQTNQASKAIIIQSLEVYFDEAAERHVEAELGLKAKIMTDYNICSRVNYSFFAEDSTSQKRQITHCDYFTTRSVNDKGFVIKFGPDIVGKKRHTYGAVERNAIQYIHALAFLFDVPVSQ